MTSRGRLHWYAWRSQCLQKSMAGFRRVLRRIFGDLGPAFGKAPVQGVDGWISPVRWTNIPTNTLAFSPEATGSLAASLHVYTSSHLYKHNHKGSASHREGSYLARPPLCAFEFGPSDLHRVWKWPAGCVLMQSTARDGEVARNELVLMSC